MPAHGAGVRGRRGNVPSELPRPGHGACGRSARPARAAGARANDGGESTGVCSCIIVQGAARWAASHAHGRAGAPPASDEEEEEERARKLSRRVLLAAGQSRLRTLRFIFIVLQLAGKLLVCQLLPQLFLRFLRLELPGQLSSQVLVRILHHFFILPIACGQNPEAELGPLRGCHKPEPLKCD